MDNVDFRNLTPKQEEQLAQAQDTINRLQEELRLVREELRQVRANEKELLDCIRELEDPE